MAFSAILFGKQAFQQNAYSFIHSNICNPRQLGKKLRENHIIPEETYQICCITGMTKAEQLEIIYLNLYRAISCSIRSNKSHQISIFKQLISVLNDVKDDSNSHIVADLLKTTYISKLCNS